MKKLLCLLVAVGLTLPAWAESKTLLNLDKNGAAIQGYDPVAFFTEKKPVKGSPEFPARYKGATYYFASRENRDAFKKDSAKYEPSFGGYCAYGVSREKLVEIDVEAFQIVDGRLLMQYSKGVREDFNNRNGVMHGGAIMAFADNLGGTLSHANLTPSQRTTIGRLKPIPTRVTRMTPKATNSTRSRSGNGSPFRSANGSASAAASDTAPRMPAKDRMNTCCQGGDGSLRRRLLLSILGR